MVDDRDRTPEPALDATPARSCDVHDTVSGANRRGLRHQEQSARSRAAGKAKFDGGGARHGALPTPPGGDQSAGVGMEISAPAAMASSADPAGGPATDPWRAGMSGPAPSERIGENTAAKPAARRSAEEGRS